ncbi:hypothetical protein B0T20DRAFT_504156 [Sordaria brevicollis]|uniref:Uncharacterized protein n=1 Tax=Sordaria brevicollis TaxID=83679 RepID=A0AAE0UF80_SORBR|nr:hypothetical protein B0T20DRAFT_504156 [Sordaria brevicollis]
MAFRSPALTATPGLATVPSWKAMNTGTYALEAQFDPWLPTALGGPGDLTCCLAVGAPEQRPMVFSSSWGVRFQKQELILDEAFPKQNHAHPGKKPLRVE